MGKLDLYTGKWTKQKIDEAVTETRENGTIYFDMRPFYKNTRAGLEKLNERLFKKRPDLILQIVTENNEDLLLLPQLENIKKLYFSNYESLDEIKTMRHLTSLEIYNVNKKALDTGFLEGLDALRDLSVTGKVKNIEAVGKCKNLEKLYLSTTIENYAFAQPLDNIKTIFIDNCIAPGDFTLLNKQTLEKLSLTQIRGLENIDAIKNFPSLKRLKLSASKIKTLPKMNSLLNLRELDLRGMKIWDNPEVIKTIPLLEKLTLEEINTKLDAERFYFLTEMETLSEINFRFMDFGKKRIEKLTARFAQSGREHIIAK